VPSAAPVILESSAIEVYLKPFSENSLAAAFRIVSFFDKQASCITEKTD
jgi:hypothetical protein